MIHSYENIISFALKRQFSALLGSEEYLDCHTTGNIHKEYPACGSETFVSILWLSRPGLEPHFYRYAMLGFHLHKYIVTIVCVLVQLTQNLFEFVI